MGMFDIFKKNPAKEEYKPILASTSDEVIGAIRLVKNEEGEKYMHINDFVTLLRQYQNKCTDKNQIILLDQIAMELMKAK